MGVPRMYPSLVTCGGQEMVYAYYVVRGGMPQNLKQCARETGVVSGLFLFQVSTASRMGRVPAGGNGLPVSWSSFTSSRTKSHNSWKAASSVWPWHTPPQGNKSGQWPTYRWSSSFHRSRFAPPSLPDSIRHSPRPRLRRTATVTSVFTCPKRSANRITLAGPGMSRCSRRRICKSTGGSTAAESAAAMLFECRS